MPTWINTYLVPAGAFFLGLFAKYLFDTLVKRDEHRRSKHDQQKKHKRESYLSFLNALEAIIRTDNPPSSESLKSAQEKFVQIEIDGSDQIVLASSILLRQFESQARGISSSHDELTPTYRKYLLELVRAELNERKPELQAIEKELLQDPLLALLARVPRTPPLPGTVEVLFTMDARHIKSKDAASKNPKIS